LFAALAFGSRRVYPGVSPNEKAAPVPSPTDRRRFLAGSAAALAGGIAAADDEPTEKKVRVAVVGTGGRGCDLIRALTTIDAADLVAVCDDYAPHLANGAKYAGPQAKAFAEFAKLLKDVRPDAVVVAVPLHLHFPMCMDALAAGVPAVFCEKTMCRTVPQAKELAAEVAKRKAVFQVGLQRRSNAIYRQGAAMVKAGLLGRITAVKCQWHRNNSWRRPVPVKRGHPDWAALERRLNWRLFTGSSGGLPTELGSHQLDVVNWFLGTHPARVQASGGIDYWRDGREVFDNVFCTYEYALTPPVPKQADPLAPPHAADPYTVRVTWSSLQTNAYEGASELFLGTKGTLLLTQKKGLFYREGAAADPGWSKDATPADDAAVIAAGKTLKLDNDPWAFRGKPFEIDADADDTRAELVDFLRCAMAGDAATVADAGVGVADAATALMATDAAVSGRWVEYPA
jgi:predicted dehydrogenase